MLTIVEQLQALNGSKILDLSKDDRTRRFFLDLREDPRWVLQIQSDGVDAMRWYFALLRHPSGAVVPVPVLFEIFKLNLNSFIYDRREIDDLVGGNLLGVLPKEAEVHWGDWAVKLLRGTEECFPEKLEQIAPGLHVLTLEDPVTGWEDISYILT